MTTPVLSKKQQKRALSGKKGPAKGLRNVLAQPYEFSWPIVNNDNVDELKLLLERSMPAIKRTSPNIPWSKLHRMKKAERQTARNEARLKLDVPPPDENIINSIVLGVNGVTRLLEKDNASCILLEANVEPMLLIKHIVSMADLRDVPVILVPFLKSVMLETVDFASAAVALKKTVAEAEDHHFHNLYKKVAEFAASLQRIRPLKLDFKHPTLGSSAFEETLNILEKSRDEEKVESNDSFRLSTDVYKYRNSRKERVFVPDSGTGSEILPERLDSNFISIGKDLGFSMSNDKHVKTRRKTRYVDIHADDNKNALEIKGGGIKLDECISTDPDPEFFGLPDDQMCASDSEVLYETKSQVLGIGEKSSLNLESDKPSRKNETGDKNFTYKSLKVKRLQGNSKRVKATKVPKRNKK